MLLTLSVSSLGPLIKSESPRLSLLDVPAFVRDSLGLHGLCFSTDLLKGANRADLDRLRDRADKQACSCLLLEDPDPLSFAHPDSDQAALAVDRARRVLQAAQILGCNAAAVRVQSPSDELALDRAIQRLREAVEYAERLEVNLLIAPHEGLTSQADQVTDLIKRVGGFRIGTLPDFAAAAASPDPVTYLRRLTPYAAVVIASTVEFDSLDAPADDQVLDVQDLLSDHVPVHTAFDLQPMVEAVISVGFDVTLAINFRGQADPVPAILASQAALEHAIERASQKD
ncbi:MAG: hypothetical protein D6695_02135 [Planctomycetota bacterium]|nr:MAG: hypothetical protein D6695_02135 [Planctomycetota bacterium]